MFIGIDIGGTKCSVSKGIFHENRFELCDRVQIKTEHASPQKMLGALSELVAELATESIQAIGISCGGPLDSKRGVILSPPNLPGWGKIEIVRYFEETFSVPVGLQNDANACALAEWKFGAGIGCRNLIFLTFGTGLGAGLILDGRLYSGTNDMAGEVGHMRLEPFGPVGYGKSGSFEGFCSGSGIAQIGKMKALEQLQQGGEVSFCAGYEELDKISAKTIADSAECGNADAIEVYEICAKKLGAGLAVLVDLLNPERIIIGSIFVRSRNLLWETTHRVLKEESLPRSFDVCKVVPAALSEQIGDYAALAVAENKWREISK